MPSEHGIFASSSALERDFDYFTCHKVNLNFAIALQFKGHSAYHAVFAGFQYAQTLLKLCTLG